jgi:hypothetical protein
MFFYIALVPALFRKPSLHEHWLSDALGLSGDGSHSEDSQYSDVNNSGEVYAISRTRPLNMQTYITTVRSAFHLVRMQSSCLV